MIKGSTIVLSEGAVRGSRFFFFFQYSMSHFDKIRNELWFQQIIICPGFEEKSF